MPGVTVDGNDAVIVYGAMQEPIRRARAGEGPSLVECMTFRHGGHHVNDPGLYLPKEELERWKAHDPLIVLRARLAGAGVDDAAIAAIDERVEALIDEAVEFATASPEPSVEAFLAEVATLKSGGDAPDDAGTAAVGRNDGEDEVPRGAPRRAPRGDGARPVRLLHRRGDRRAGRLVQGHRGPARRSSARAASSTRP